jgi:hypothetical protein
MRAVPLTVTWDSRWTLATHRDSYYFVCFALVHVAIWTVLPEFTQPNAPLDTIELLYWGRQWEWGYYKHPPLPAWILHGTSIFWAEEVWPSYLLSQFCTVVCFWAVWNLARSALSSRLALVVPFLLEGSYYYNFTTPEFNNNVVSRCCWALVIWATYRAMTTGKAWRWVFVGLFLAAGMLSKYDMAILALTLLGFSWIHPDARRHWGTPGPWWMLAVALACFWPHLLWLVRHEYLTLHYLAERSEGAPGWERHLLHPFKFAAGQLLAVAPLLLLAQPLLGRRPHLAPRPWNPKTRFLRDYVLTVTLVPLGLILLTSLLTGARLRSMWGAPMWTFAPLALVLVFETRDSLIACRQTAWRCGIIGLVFALAFAGRNTVSPYLREKGSAVHYPGDVLADLVEDRWEALFPEDSLRWVGGPWWPAANVSFYLDDHRAGVYADLDARISPWVDDQQIRRMGGVLLWDMNEEEQFIEWKQRFPQARVVEPVRARWQTGAALEPVVLGMMIVPPESHLHHPGETVASRD